MIGKISIFRFVRSVVAGILAVGLIFAVAGFLLAGWVGFANMGTFGLAIGLFGSLILTFAILVQSYGLDTFAKTRMKWLGLWMVR